MKGFIILFASLFLFQNCQKSHEESSRSSLLDKKGEAGLSSENGTGRVGICHYTGNDTYEAIVVSESALPAHLEHGDYINDYDNDGYTAFKTCGSGDDCNDKDPKINPGAEEICGDKVDNNCNGLIDENCCSIPKELIGTWKGVVVTPIEKIEIELVITSTTATVSYPGLGCEGTWTFDCSRVIAKYPFVETITKGKCTPIECTVAATYLQDKGLIIFNNTSDPNCKPSTPVTGELALVK
ncbi:MAG TPA: putative metal-binding motif-containing protein [Flavisolibacter sp.]|nr:putative metal-binding motif-containing protein [Flavisolibacter sp.]